jgi:hypothetical protein
MPPQQHDRLLDLIDEAQDFRAHDSFRLRPEAAFDSLSSTIEYEMTGRSGKGYSTNGPINISRLC